MRRFCCTRYAVLRTAAELASFVIKSPSDQRSNFVTILIRCSVCDRPTSQCSRPPQYEIACFCGQYTHPRSRNSTGFSSKTEKHRAEKKHPSNTRYPPVLCSAVIAHISNYIAPFICLFSSHTSQRPLCVETHSCLAMANHVTQCCLATCCTCLAPCRKAGAHKTHPAFRAPGSHSAHTSRLSELGPMLRSSLESYEATNCCCGEEGPVLRQPLRRTHTQTPALT